jgi:hypothetical protein
MSVMAGFGFFMWLASLADVVNDFWIHLSKSMARHKLIKMLESVRLSQRLRPFVPRNHE